jgi:hypothetical protein
VRATAVHRDRGGIQTERVDDTAISIRAGVRSYAPDAEHAKALWAKSEEMMGEKF